VRGVLHFLIHGKGGKIRFISIHPLTLRRINAYMAWHTPRASSSSWIVLYSGRRHITSLLKYVAKELMWHHCELFLHLSASP
jgi:hypothetical protein